MHNQFVLQAFRFIYNNIAFQLKVINLIFTTKMEIFIKYQLLIFIIGVTYLHAHTFNDYKQEMENIVLQIASNMEEYYANWCTDGIATCETLTYNGCLGIKQKYCDAQFSKPVSCFSSGYYRSSASSVQFPPGMDYNNLTNQDIRFVCSSAKLEQTFQNISTNRDKRFSGMYFGSNRGVFREFPGNFRGKDAKCDDYDPRNRPWYTIAASGAKNIMILLDISSSMYNRSQDAINAAVTMVASLSISDNVGVLTFQNDTTVIGKEKQILIRATNDNKKVLIEAIKKIRFTFDKQTNFLAAFQKGLQLVNNTVAEGYSGCSMAQNIFLLITDGNPTVDNKTSPDTLIQAINDFTKQKQSAIKRLIIFIYALGNINKEYLRNLSCRFNGIVITSPETQQLQSTSQVATQLIQFYKYLSVGIRFTHPIWTEPYQDYYTNIEMVTVSMPAYYTDKQTNLTIMFGVAGLDINMNYFTNFGYDVDEASIKLAGESACQKSIIDNCKLEYLRSPTFRCNLQNCTVNTSNQSRCLTIPSTSTIYIYRNSTTDESICCGLTMKTFIIIISTSFGSAFIIAILIWQRKRIWRKFCDRSYRNINKTDRSERKRKNSNRSQLSNKKSLSNTIESNGMFIKEPSI